MRLDGYIPPEGVKIGSAARLLYEKEDAFLEAMKAAGKELARVLGHADSDYWSKTLPETIYFLLDNTDDRAAAIAAQVFAQRNLSPLQRQSFYCDDCKKLVVFHRFVAGRGAAKGSFYFGQDLDDQPAGASTCQDVGRAFETGPEGGHWGHLCTECDTKDEEQGGVKAEDLEGT